MSEKRFEFYEDEFSIIKDNLTNATYGEFDTDMETICLHLNDFCDENQKLKEQLILANAFIKMIENCYEDMTIEDILYEKYGEFQDELHLQMAIAKEEIE